LWNKKGRIPMQNAVLVGLSRQMALARELDVVANNVANLNTTGYKADGSLFEEYLSSAARTGQSGGRVSYVRDSGVWHDMSAGPIERTGNPLDVAVDGNAFLVVQTPNGERYTRNGHFGLDASGQLVTSNGDAVQGDGGAITITPDDGDVHIAQDGTVSGKNGQIGRIRVVDFANPRALTKEGASLYAAGGQSPASADGFTLQSGMLETSNVEPVIEISHMIEVMRAYQATATMTQTQEDLMRQAIDKLGSLQS